MLIGGSQLLWSYLPLDLVGFFAGDQGRGHPGIITFAAKVAESHSQGRIDCCSALVRAAWIIQCLRRLLSLSLYSFLEDDINGIAGFLANGIANPGFYGQFVPAITQGHKRRRKWMAIDCAAHFDQAAGFEELNGIRPD